MRVWIEQFGPMLAGLAGLLTALAGLLSAWHRRIPGQLEDCEEELERCKRDSDGYQAQVLLALRHIFRLEKALTMAGKRPPPRPEGLDL